MENLPIQTLLFRRFILAATLLSPECPHTDEMVLKELQKLKFPVWLTIKKDGIRVGRLAGWLLSRTLKRIPNKELCERSLIIPGGMDMEACHTTMPFNEVASIVMSHEHSLTSEINFYIIDWFRAGGYLQRLSEVQRVMCDMPSSVQFDFPILCETPESVLRNFLLAEEKGEEGVCFRLGNGPYKAGRSTLKEQYLVKLARYTEEEATIIGFKEQMENANPSRRNAVGMMDRSHSEFGMFGKDTLGAFIVTDKYDNTFSVGSGVGLTNNLRKQVWSNRESYLGQTITFKCKAHGRKIKPRSPIFKGFRKDL